MNLLYTIFSRQTKKKHCALVARRHVLFIERTGYTMTLQNTIQKGEGEVNNQFSN